MRCGWTRGAEESRPRLDEVAREEILEQEVDEGAALREDAVDPRAAAGGGGAAEDDPERTDPQPPGRPAREGPPAPR